MSINNNYSIIVYDAYLPTLVSYIYACIYTPKCVCGKNINMNYKF